MLAIRISNFTVELIIVLRGDLYIDFQSEIIYNN